jgi:hypothetical protein
VFAVRRRKTATRRTLQMFISGEVDAFGVPYDNPFNGLSTNLFAFEVNLVDPVATPATGRAQRCSPCRTATSAAARSPSSAWRSATSSPDVPLLPRRHRRLDPGRQPPRSALMASVRVRLRNAGNTATTAELDGAFDVSFQIQRNDVGVGSFKLPNRDSERPLVSRGSVVRFALAGEGRFIARVIDDRIVDVSVGDEDVEATEFICAGILSDWGEAVVRRSTVPQCDLVPSLDERIWNWASGESNPLLYHGDWPRATAFAGQGWGSAFYTGEPAGWTDSAAFFVWAEGGRLPFPDDDLSVNALPGRCLFKDIFLVGAGKKMLEWACDNAGNLWVNGKQVQSGTDFRKKQVYEFETTAGFLTLAWDVTNAEDDGPAGGNPGGLIASLRNDGPRATSSGAPRPRGRSRTTPTTPTRSTPPTCAAWSTRPTTCRTRLARSSGWPVSRTRSSTTTGPSPSATSTTRPRSSRGTRSRTSRSGSTTTRCSTCSRCSPRCGPTGGCSPATASSCPATRRARSCNTVGVTLTTGYSTAGQADPDIVNVLDLSWSVTRAQVHRAGGALGRRVDRAG